MRISLALLVLVALLSGCKSSPNTDNEYSQGQIVSRAVDEVWVATHSALRGLGRGPKRFDEAALEAQAVIGGEEVTVRIEEAGSTKTIVRVVTHDPTVATDVLQAITALLRRP